MLISCPILEIFGNSTPSLAPGKFGPELQLDSSNRQKSYVITQNSAYKPHKTLGYWKDPAGGQRKQFSKLQAKCNKEAKFVSCSALSQSEAWKYYTACFVPSISYVLPNSFFSQSELEKLSKKAMSAIIAKCGFNRNTQRTIIYGPRCYGGARFYPLHLLQGTEQILTFIQHWRAKSILSNLLRIAVSWHQLQLGTGVSFFKDVHTHHPHAESKWLASLRAYLATINASFELDDSYIPPTQRENKFYLMDSVLASNRFTSSQIRQINYCRLYLQAVTLSDITNIKGDQIDPAKLKGMTSLQSSQSRLHWIYQE